MAMTDENSPAYLPGFFQIALGTVHDTDDIVADRPEPVLGSAGISTAPTCTSVASGSSGRDTRRT